MYSYPFTFELPQWLPASMFLASSFEECICKIQYKLVAQFTPASYEDWEDSKLKISKIREEQKVFIYQPARHLPVHKQDFSLTNEVGGFLGLGKKQCVTKLTFKQKEFYLGEAAKVKFTCDNRACSKPIKNFKIKLFRRYLAKDPESKSQTEKNEYCAIQKYPGCPAGERLSRELEFKIPKLDHGTDKDVEGIVVDRDER